MYLTLKWGVRHSFVKCLEQTEIAITIITWIVGLEETTNQYDAFICTGAEMLITSCVFQTILQY